ncbi:MAG TPA: hypothetical protein VMV38_01200 [Candidatus Paceibacterota bacterium]|nr:hypothetical protein [Candidatus Paceibacterota bacterium]
MQFPEDDIGSLERAREALYSSTPARESQSRVSSREDRVLPHAWKEKLRVPHMSQRHVRFAGLFLGISVLFFLSALAVAGYLLYFGGNSVSPDKITIAVLGPTTIAGGDTVPLSLTITNRNPVSVQNATIEVDFPDGTRSATDVLTPYPRYVENLGTLASGETVTRSIKAVVFGAAGQTVTLPISFSYATQSSNAIFQKKSSYALAIASTPLSLSVDALTETVSGASLSFAVTVRSNATVPIDNVVLAASSPFGFSLASSSLPMSNSNFFIGTLAPGATKQVTMTGTLTGQDSEQRVFHFTVGTAKSPQDQSLGISYMTQDATVSIASPFITTTLALNGDTSSTVVLTSGTSQNATLSYTNTLPISVTDASITVTLAGSAIDYTSIKTTSGFYNSSNHTIIFSKDTDPTLASLAPGASGTGTFTFLTIPAGTASPTATFSIVASGTRVGQSNVPEQVTTSVVQSVKIATSMAFSARASHVSGPIPPLANQPTVYSIVWDAQTQGAAVAGGTVTATLPSYISYISATADASAFSYDSVSHTVTWNVGDLPQKGSAEGVFQVSLLPSTSQKGSVVALTSTASFSGYDRFAGVQISASANPATTETPQDPGYVPADGVVR